MGERLSEVGKKGFNLNFRAFVCILVAATNDLKNCQPDSGALGDQVADGEGLEERRPLVPPVRVESPKLGPDLLGDRGAEQLDVVPDQRVRLGTSGVGDVLDGDVTT